MTTQRMSLDDFMTGLLASLAVHGVRAVSMRGTAFPSAVVSAFDTLDRMPSQDRPELAFWLTCHPVYQDSADVREAVIRAMHRGLVSLDHPGDMMRILVSEPESHLYLEKLPGDAEVHQMVLDSFLERFGACPAH